MNTPIRMIAILPMLLLAAALIATACKSATTQMPDDTSLDECLYPLRLQRTGADITGTKRDSLKAFTIALGSPAPQGMIPHSVPWRFKTSLGRVMSAPKSSTVPSMPVAKSKLYGKERNKDDHDSTNGVDDIVVSADRDSE